MQMIIKFLRRLNEGHLRFLDLKNKVDIFLKNYEYAYTASILNAIQSERSSGGAKFNNTSINNWKPLFEANFSTNST